MQKNSTQRKFKPRKNSTLEKNSSRKKLALGKIQVCDDVIHFNKQKNKETQRSLEKYGRVEINLF